MMDKEFLCLNCPIPTCDDTSPQCFYTIFKRAEVNRPIEVKAPAKKRQNRNMDNYRAYQRQYQRERWQNNADVRERKRAVRRMRVTI